MRRESKLLRSVGVLSSRLHVVAASSVALSLTGCVVPAKSASARRTLAGPSMTDGPAPGIARAAGNEVGAVIGWDAGSAWMGASVPDPQLAVSSTAVIVGSWGRFTFFTRGGATMLVGSKYQSFSNAELWKDKVTPSYVIPAGYDHGDDRVLFDEHRRRFWLLTVLASRTPGKESRWAIAVSKSEDPRDGFWGYSFAQASPRIGQIDEATDYPNVGMDGSALYISNLVFGAESDARYFRVLALDTKMMSDGVPQEQVRWEEYTDWRQEDGRPLGHAKPAMHHGSTLEPDGHTHAWFASRIGYTNRVALFSIVDPFSGRFTTTHRFVTLPSSPAQEVLQVDMEQPETKARLATTNVGDYIQSAVFRNHHLYFSSHEGGACEGIVRNAARIVELDVDVRSAQPKVVTDSFVGCHAATDPKGAVFDYAYPAVEVNRAGVLGFVAARSGPTDFLEMRVGARFPGEIGSGSTVSAKKSTTIFGSASAVDSTGFADLGGAALDPFDDLGMWFVHELATTDHTPNWGLHVAKILGRAMPDLIPVSMSIPVASSRRGASVQVQALVQNEGEANIDVPTLAKLVLSRDAAIGPDDITCGTYEVKALRSNEIDGVTTHHACDIPASVAPGRYYLGVIADSEGRVEETSESNNGNPAWLPPVTLDVE